MANEFYRVKVTAVDEAMLHLNLQVLDPDQTLPTTPGWALMMLYEATYTTLDSRTPEPAAATRRRKQSPLAKALAGRDIEAETRSPSAYVTSVKLSAKKAKSASYEIRLAAAKWGSHVKAGMVFESTSYGVEEPAAPLPKIKSGELKRVVEGLRDAALPRRAVAFRSLQKLQKKLWSKFAESVEGAEAALTDGVVGLLRERLATENFVFSQSELLRALHPFSPTATAMFKQVTATLIERGLPGDAGSDWVRAVRFSANEWVDELATVAAGHPSESVRVDAIGALAGAQSPVAKAASKKFVPWVKKLAARKNATRQQVPPHVFEDLLGEL